MFHSYVDLPEGNHWLIFSMFVLNHLMNHDYKRLVWRQCFQQGSDDAPNADNQLAQLKCSNSACKTIEFLLYVKRMGCPVQPFTTRHDWPRPDTLGWMCFFLSPNKMDEGIIGPFKCHHWGWVKTYEITIFLGR
jgi:hypothetical protein